MAALKQLLDALRESAEHGHDSADVGTNYYLHQKPDCEGCGRPVYPLHIGKSAED